MCNHYQLRNSATEVAQALGANTAIMDVPKEHIYPKYAAPVVRAKAGVRAMELMQWGFPMQVQGKTKMLTKYVTNARNLHSPFWKGAVSAPAARCLVPFSKFAEPRPGKDAETGRPREWWFEVSDQDVPCFAGFTRYIDDTAYFAFCTSEPNPIVKPKHEKAMPVILLQEDHDRWLHGSFDDVLELQAPYPSQMMALD